MTDYEKMMKQARDAFAEGRTRPLSFRVQQLRALMQMVTENEDRIIKALHKDLRKSRQESIIMEIDFIRNELLGMLANVEAWMKPEKVEKSLVTLMDTTMIVREPYGVVLVMSAWNYPFQLSLSPFIGAITAGNCAVLKPSEISPATAELLEELIPKYLDQDCFHVVNGGVPETTALLKERFDYIFYTGSTTVGKIVREAANKYLTPVTLELGGKSPVYIDDTCDMTIAARRMLWGKTSNLGQTCIAPDYLLCTREVEQKFLEVAKEVLKNWYGDNPEQSADLGRIVTDRHVKRLQGLMEGSGTVAIGGKVVAEDKYIEPTVLVNVKPTDPIMQEEIFGPVLPIHNVSGPEDAIKFINSREKPLTLYVFSAKRSVIDSFINNTSSGSVCANDTLVHIGVESLPFGGVGYSGMGGYHGKFSFDTFSHLKSVMIRSFSNIGEKLAMARYPPYSDKKIDKIRPLIRRRQMIKLGSFAYLAVLFLGIGIGYAIDYFVNKKNQSD